MFAHTLLPALAVFGVAAAQTSSLCSQATATINSQADATQYASCSTIDGDVLISSAASGVLQLDGPEKITGNLICHNAGALTSIGSATLASVGKSLDLFNLTVLSTFSFTDLETVNNISWISLPALSSLTLPSVISTAKFITISNTFLSTLDGINIDTAETLEVNNNNRLKEFSTQVSNVTSVIDINSNGKLLEVAFPNLIWAANLTLRNVSSLSIPSLATINGSFGLYENYFTSLSAPNLTTVGNFGGRSGSLAIVANPSLANITIPGLTSVGGAVQIANNSALNGISFSKLSTIGGAIDFTGNFSSVSLPGLTIVSGGSNIESTSDITSSCSDITDNNAIAGTNNCKGKVANPTGIATGSGTATKTGSSSSSTSSKGAAVTFGVGESVVGLGLVGTLMQMLL
ncbi:Cell surface GPI-anchored [Hyphodiscus hymeniophilus]|uniref:Cell surface GPI-anchored n=1 Tax=Hyphodiscus hymeniophilus TaxID=353542 RepID=A0A9P7B077_9HELO|nr:Cell surface GPI-anchored [Hyphodiscus hymeniophilus]